jgi:transcriptional regulator with XRE-family HTH domain
MTLEEMSKEYKQLNQLIKTRGFRLGAVAEAIDVAPYTISRWTHNAPIGKLVKISRFTGIPLDEIVRCLVIEEDSVEPTLREPIDSSD